MPLHFLKSCVKLASACALGVYGQSILNLNVNGGADTINMQNGLGTPEFFRLCSLSGVLPAITANFRSDSSGGMNT